MACNIKTCLAWSDWFWSCCSFVNLETNFGLSWTHLNFLVQSPPVVVYSTTLSIKYFCRTYLFTCIFNQLLYVTLKMSKSSQNIFFPDDKSTWILQHLHYKCLRSRIIFFFFCWHLHSSLHQKWEPTFFLVCLQQLYLSDFFSAKYLKYTPSLIFSQGKFFQKLIKKKNLVMKSQVWHGKIWVSWEDLQLCLPVANTLLCETELDGKL